ncbi:MAG TPA: nitronate monooxygenase [Burkholderiaceae bacterium]|jgi:nitronate monooxygenase
MPLRDLLGIELPIVQAPMAGSQFFEMAAAASNAGGLGSLPCALLSATQQREQLAQLKQATSKPFNLNFFCHTPPVPDAAREAAWKALLRPYFIELGLDPSVDAPAAQRLPFDEAACALVEAGKPAVVSFHFGLPVPELLVRVKAAGIKIMASATTVAEARWLVARGVDVVIAQGAEAGGHRGIFLSDDISTQMGLFALLPQIVAAVDVPVIAAGGIAEQSAVRAAMKLGAAGVQVGTAYLYTPEARISAAYRAALQSDAVGTTALTNLFSGRPARGIVNRAMRELGPINAAAPAFPLAGGALAPLRAACEAKGSGDFSSMWSGQAAALSRRDLDTAGLTRWLGEATQP